MEARKHHYSTRLEWTGNLGAGTTDYRVYSRDHEISIPTSSAPILGSSDPSFRGDPNRYNPEELLLASLSACHMLWYLHLCAVNGVIVTDYQDQATATMEEVQNGSGRFTEAVLQPTVTVSSNEMIPQALELHAIASQKCFIANSVNFPVLHQPNVVTAR